MTHGVDISEVVRQAIFALALVIFAAKFGGELLVRMGSPRCWESC